MPPLAERPPPTDRSRIACARRVTAVGLAINLLLSAAKILAGIFGHSQAVIADGVHSLSDLSSDIAVLAGSYVWGRPPDARHPYGHKRIETLVAVLVGGLMAAAGIGLAINGLHAFGHPPARPPAPIALVAALVSIGVKEWLFRWTRRCAARNRSVALEANALHHRSDAFSSIPVALAVAGADLVPSWAYLDSAAALVVSVFILHAAWKTLAPALGEVTDQAAPESVRHHLKAHALEIPGVREVHSLRSRYAGGRLHIDLHLLVDPGLTVREGHAIASRVRRHLFREEPDILEVLVHIEPFDTDHSKPEDPF